VVIPTDVASATVAKMLFILFLTDLKWNEMDKKEGGM